MLTPTGEAEEPVDLAHPVGVALRQVVVHRDDMDALAGQRVQIGGQGGDERLAFAGAHLGDLAVVQHDAADKLHVEMAHMQRALGGLAHDRERLGQQLFQRRALRDTVAEFLGFRTEGVSSSALRAGSNSFTCRTVREYCLMSRSFRLPNIFLRTP